MADPSVMWRDLLTPTTSSWADVFDAALHSARQRYRFVQGSAESAGVHLMVVAFEAQHLRRVVEEDRLPQLLQSPPAAIEQLVVVACGVSDPMPELADIADLLNDPRLVGIPRRLPHVPRTPLELEPICASLLLGLGSRHQRAAPPLLIAPRSGAYMDEIDNS